MPVRVDSIIFLVFVTGAVELLDVTDKLPGLIYNPGLTKWKVGSILF